jgi:hypothetical protein
MATLWVSERTPTVTTLSRPWIDQVSAVAGFANVQWESAMSVPVTTLETLIAQYGEPAFCKIDVEGFELEALRGLERPLRALSFEYSPATIDITLGCIMRLGELGAYEFNWSRGERHHWESAQWLTPQATMAQLAAMHPATGSGDVYARLVKATQMGDGRFG